MLRSGADAPTFIWFISSLPTFQSGDGLIRVCLRFSLQYKPHCMPWAIFFGFYGSPKRGCIQDKNEFNYVNCDYCTLKEEIVPQNYSLFNKYIVSGVYWNIRLILAASPSDIGDASIDQVSVRLSIASDQSIGGYENKVGSVSDELRQELCEMAKNTLYDGIDLFDVERPTLVY